jgi:peptide/nickel transport system substrate-binding protein
MHDVRRSRGGPSRLRLVALLTATLLALSACGGGDDGGTTSPQPGGEGTDTTEAPDEGEPQQGGEIVVAVESETNNWLPGTFAGTQAGYNVARSIYDSLMLKTEDGEVEPYLAESLEPNDDLTEWTLTLREGVMFHDGTPLNAEALKSNFDDHLKAEGANTLNNLRDVESMEIDDELTVRYVLSQPNAGLPELLQGPIGWPFSPTAAAELGEEAGNRPVGTGPFKFVSWTRDESFVAERNEDYWQEGLPYLDRITFRPIPDEDTRAASLESGDIDATHSVRLSAFLSQVNEMDGVDVHLGPGNSGSGAIFNTSQPPVDDVRIRRSLSYALDQRGLIEVIAGAAADQTEERTQYFAESSPFYSETVADAWPTNDPEEAQRLYDEYINDPDRSDGQPVGSPVQIEFNCTNIPSLQEQAQAYQGMWQAIGYQVQLNALEQSVHIQNALAGEFMVNCWRQGGDNDPYIDLSNAFGDPEISVQNFTDYHNETVQEILDTLRTEADTEVRAEAIERLGLLFAEDVPNTWTGGNNEFIAVRDALNGVTTWTFPDGTTGNGAHTGITLWGQVWLS